jgi:hypothetical protein
LYEREHIIMYFLTSGWAAATPARGEGEQMTLMAASR